MELDLKDKKILYELDIDARQTFNQLSRKVNLSKDVINYSVKRLEEEGYIKGYQTIINSSKIGYSTVRMHLKLIDTTPKIEKEIIKFLIKKKNVFTVGETEGEVDLTFGILIKDLFELKEFEIEFDKKFKKYIKTRKFAVYMEVHHFHRAYLVNKKQDTINPKIIQIEKEVIDVDKKDLEILKLLSKDARIPIIKISKKLDMNATTVANRIRKLERDKIILGYKLLFGFNKIGYGYFKLDLNLKDISSREKIIEYCHKNPQIVYVLWTVGGSDLEIFLEIKDTGSLLDLVEKMRETFPEIKEWNYTTFRKYHKFNYFLD